MDNKETNFLDKIYLQFLDILKQIGIIFLYMFIAIFLNSIFDKFLTSNNLILSNTVYLFIDLIMIIIFLLIFRKTIIPDFYKFKKEPSKYLTKYTKYWLVGLGIMMLSNTIISTYLGMPENEAANREIMQKLPIYAIFSSIIMAPITEELLTRTILKNTFKHKWIYIILSGLIFGFMHCLSIFNSKNFAELFYIIPYGALGSSFAYMYSKSNNVWTNITFHAIHNTMVILLLIFSGALV